jgi:hypothetical protein
VSRKTCYEHFEAREGCFIAAFEEAAAAPPTRDAQVPPMLDPSEGLGGRITHRTLSVLTAIAALNERGSDPSNREVAEHTGIRGLEADAPQLSRVLWCLEALELIENTARGQVKGWPNAWRLTAKGEGVRRELEGSRLSIRQ